MVTMVTMSKGYVIFWNCQIALADQAVHVRMTSTMLLILIGIKQLLNCPILPKNTLFFNVDLQRY